MKNFFIIAGLLIALIAGFFIKSFIAYQKQDTILQQFRPLIRGYLEYADSPVEGGGAYIKGKVIPVNIKTAMVDEFTYPLLPESLKPVHPDEVKTLVLITYSERKVGHYEDQETEQVTGDAYRSVADVRLVDLDADEVIDEQQFTGGQPAQGLTREGDYTSQWPIFDILEYIKSLPRK